MKTGVILIVHARHFFDSCQNCECQKSSQILILNSFGRRKWWQMMTYSAQKVPSYTTPEFGDFHGFVSDLYQQHQWLYRHFWYQQPGSLPYKMLESQVVTSDCPLIFRAKVRKARYNAWPQETTVWGQKRSWESTKKNSSVPLKPSLLVAHAVRGR